MVARPSSSRPSSAKKEMAVSSDSTTIPTLSIRLIVTQHCLSDRRNSTPVVRTFVLATIEVPIVIYGPMPPLITARRLTRVAGLAAVAAGVLFIGVQIKHPHLDAASITTTEMAIRDSLKVLMAVFALVGITGMYLPQV